MDPCNPDTNLENVRSAFRTKLSVPKSVAKNYSRTDMCNAFKRCKKSSNLFPPMKMKMFNGYIYLIDSNSPLSAKEYYKLFEKGTKTDVVTIAKKLGLSYVDRSKDELMVEITSILHKMDLLEPIKAMKIQSVLNKNRNANNGFNQPQNLNQNTGFNQPGNRNQNANTGLNRPMNQNTGFNRPMNQNTGFNQPRNNGNTTGQSFVPGKPSIKAPNVYLNINRNGTTNSLANYSKRFKFPSGNNSGVTSKSKEANNTNKILKELRGIKAQIGYIPNATPERSSASSSVFS